MSVGRQDTRESTKSKPEGPYNTDFYVSGNGESSEVQNYLSVFSKMIPGTVQRLNQKKETKEKGSVMSLRSSKHAEGNEVSIKIDSWRQKNQSLDRRSNNRAC